MVLGWAHSSRAREARLAFVCLRVVFDLLRHSLRGHGCSLHIDGTRVLENSSTVQAPTVCRAQVLADMKPSFTRTPSSFRDGLEGQGIAMPFARGQVVASCEFLKQFDSQAKYVPC